MATTSRRRTSSRSTATKSTQTHQTHHETSVTTSRRHSSKTTQSASLRSTRTSSKSSQPSTSTTSAAQPDHGSASIRPASPSTSVSSHSSTASPSSLSGGKIGGIVIGVLAGVVILALLAIWLRRRRPKVHEITSPTAMKEFDKTHRGFDGALNPTRTFVQADLKLPKDPPKPRPPPKVPPQRTTAKLDTVSKPIHDSTVKSLSYSPTSQYSIPSMFEIDGRLPYATSRSDRRPVSELNARPTSDLVGISKWPQHWYVEERMSAPWVLPDELKEMAVPSPASRRTTLSAVSGPEVQRMNSVKSSYNQPNLHVISWIDSDGVKRESPVEFHIGPNSPRRL